MGFVDSAATFDLVGVPMAFVDANSSNVEPTVFVRRFTVDEYHRMAEAGMLRPGDRVELLEGIVAMMSPIGLVHLKAVTAMHECLQRMRALGWQAVCQQPIRLGSSEPVPDVTMLRGNVRDYDRIPEAKDIGLIVEAADSTLPQDRTIKASIYAAAGIPEYWIVNLIDKKLEVHRRPTAAAGDQPARYGSVESFGPDHSVVVVLDGIQVGVIAVRDVLP